MCFDIFINENLFLVDMWPSTNIKIQTISNNKHTISQQA